MLHDLDKPARTTAHQIGRDFPQWLVMWGTYSRRYWAYPTFPAPAGTIVYARDPNDLARQMREIQISRDVREPKIRSASLVGIDNDASNEK
jgi:hypothetical protein